MKRALTCIAILAVVATLGSAHAAGAVSDNEKLLERARQAAAHDLKDPGSAQFRSLEISPTLPSNVCGEINAKNSYGAYVGFQPFRYDDADKTVTLLDPDSDYYEPDLTVHRIVCPNPEGDK